jgi:hypothetical protein
MQLGSKSYAVAMEVRRLQQSQALHSPLHRMAVRSMSKDADLVRGFDTMCLHGGYLPDETTSRGVPIYRYVDSDSSETISPCTPNVRGV